MTLKYNRAPLLYYIKLCAAFESHWYIQTGGTVRKRSIRVKTGDFFVPCDLENWQMTLKNNRAPFLYYAKLYASFQIHRWSQSWVTVRKRSIWVKIGDFCSAWPWNLMDYLAPLLSNIKLCASFHHHMWIQTGVTVRKRLNGVMTSVTLTFDLWSWPFAWSSRLSIVITPENCRIIRSQEH